MKVAIVHDYLKEYGGAERVLKVLTEIYPDAPIYTAFYVANSTAGREFRNCKIIQSWLAPILKIGRLYSPLRFLIPLIWGSFDLSEYDLVITSSSWYITRGFKAKKTICYCHTPPRWLYGYETSVGFTKYWPVRLYALIVGHFLRLYDYKTAQKVDLFLANSENVQTRITKFYRRDSKVVYPPVDVEEIIKKTQGMEKGNYFLIVSRLVGAKGIEQAIAAAQKIGFKLKIVGEGRSDKARPCQEVKYLGRVEDDELYELYGKAKGFIALARDEDFGMTVVEAQAAGTPVIAFNGGGFKETVINGKTGILINDTDEKTIEEAIKKINKIKWDKETLQKNALRFSKERFIKEIKEICRSYQK
jgi:glycosyltransferase involved in cell wall biosynthesis